MKIRHMKLHSRSIRAEERRWALVLRTASAAACSADPRSRWSIVASPARCARLRWARLLTPMREVRSISVSRLLVVAKSNSTALFAFMAVWDGDYQL